MDHQDGGAAQFSGSDNADSDKLEASCNIGEARALIETHAQAIFTNRGGDLPPVGWRAKQNLQLQLPRPAKPGGMETYLLHPRVPNRAKVKRYLLLADRRGQAFGELHAVCRLLQAVRRHAYRVLLEL